MYNMKKIEQQKYSIFCSLLTHIYIFIGINIEKFSNDEERCIETKQQYSCKQMSGVRVMYAVVA